MTIDASLRRPNLKEQDRGNVVPDSRKKLEDAPLLVMEPGTETLALQFTDKKGLTDDYGNVYVGYGGGGGSSFTVSSDPPDSIDSEADDANDGDLLIYVATEEKYLPFSFEDAGVPRASIADNPLDGDVLIYSTVDGVYNPNTFFEAGIPRASQNAPNNLEVLVWDNPNQNYEPVPLIDFFDLVQHDGTVALEGDVLIYKAGIGKWSPGPQIVTEWVQFIIEKPQNRSYRFSESLPYDIAITGTSGLIESGPGTISFPAGVLAAGTVGQITVTGTTNQSAFLRAQIRYTRNLNIV